MLTSYTGTSRDVATLAHEHGAVRGIHERADVRRLRRCGDEQQRTVDLWRRARRETMSAEAISAAALNLREPEETETSFKGNALLKAHAAARTAKMPALADDSGIEVDALGGQPGVRSARFAGEHASDAQNLQRLLAELEEVPESWRQARYRCVIACVKKIQAMGLVEAM